MKRSFLNMVLNHTQTYLQRWGRLKNTHAPKLGWVNMLRTALGMTLTQLAQRMKVSAPTLAKIEKGERAGTVSLNTLRKVANALDCELVYALVPRKDLEQMLTARARAVARRRLATVTHSMRLEAQAPSRKQTKRQFEQLTKELLEERPRELWD